MRHVVAGLLLLAVSACSAAGEDQKLTVFAASSLEIAFQDLAARFEASHPGTDVVLGLAGSQTLATQIVNGAEPEVFASADHQQMERAARVREPEVGPVGFAANRLVIAVASGNPKRIAGVEDLTRDDLILVLGAEEVPVGAYARDVLAAAGVEPNVSSYEPDVGLVLAKVALGEADAGIVYESDLERAEAPVEGVEIPASVNVVADYPIAAWGEGLGAAFVDLVLSPPGRESLRAAGFRP